MATPVQQSSSPYASYGTGFTAVITKPSGTVDGDFLLALVSSTGDPSQTSAPTPPAGWTQLGSYGFGGGTGLAAFFRQASSEPANWTWTWINTGANAGKGGFVIRFSGQYVASPFDGNASATSTATSSPSYANTISPAITNDLLIGVTAQAHINTFAPVLSGYAIATNNPTWNSPETAYLLNGAASVYTVLGFSTAVRPQTGATGNLSMNANNTISGTSIGMQIALSRNIISTASVSDTETATESVTSMRKRNASVSDTETVTDMISSSKSRAWSNQSKNTSTWTDQTKN